MDHKLIGVFPLRWTAHPVGINHATQFFPHGPSASGMDLSPPSVEQDDSLFSMDAPSAPTQKTAGCVSRLTPRKLLSGLMACIGRFLNKLHSRRA